MMTLSYNKATTLHSRQILGVDSQSSVQWRLSLCKSCGFLQLIQSSHSFLNPYNMHPTVFRVLSLIICHHMVLHYFVLIYQINPSKKDVNIRWINHFVHLFPFLPPTSFLSLSCILSFICFPCLSFTYFSYPPLTPVTTCDSFMWRTTQTQTGGGGRRVNVRRRIH